VGGLSEPAFGAVRSQALNWADSVGASCAFDLVAAVRASRRPPPWPRNPRWLLLMPGTSS